MKYLRYIILMLFCCLPIYCGALEANLDFVCDKTLLNANESTNCSIKLNSSSGGVIAFNGTVKVSSNLELVQLNINDSWTNSSSSNQIILETEDIKTGNITIGTFSVTAKTVVPETTESIALIGISIKDENNTSNNYDDITHSIRIPSNNASLESLSVNKGILSPSFDANHTSYVVSDVDSESIKITATGPSNARITGTGEHTLEYGDNEIKVQVRAESGTTKTYTLVVKRVDNRSSDNTLKSIVVQNGELNDQNRVVFPSTVDTFSVTATPNHDKAKVSYSTNNVALSLGETYTIFIYVTAENGERKTYTVTATRKDDRSKNNNLQSLTLNGSNISLTASEISYTKKVSNDVKTATIIAKAQDEKAKVQITGSKTLKVGSNTFTITVTAENGAEKIYKLTVIREGSEENNTSLSSNNYLSKLSIKEIDFSFDKKKLSYDFEVENNISKINIEYTVEDSKATVDMQGSKDLKVGLNTIHILVTAENGETADYKLNITRKEKNYEVENKESTIINAIKDKDYEQVIVNGTGSNELKIPKNIIKELINNKKKVTYYVVKGERKEFSIVLDGNLFTSYDKDLFYGLTFQNQDENLNKLVGSRKHLVLNFENSGEVPTGTVYNVRVEDTFSNSSTLYLYHYQLDAGKLVLKQENLMVQNGYVSVPIDQLSTYVLLNTTLTEENNNPVIDDNNDNNQTFPTLYVVGGGLVAVLLIILVILISSKKKKQTKKEDKVETTTQPSIENNVSPINEVNTLADVPTSLGPINTNISPVPNLEDTMVLDLDEPIANHMEFLLGILAMDIDDYLQKCPLADLKNSQLKEGIVIVGFEPNSLLEKAGLHQGDVLVEMNNQKIINKEQFRNIVSSIQKGEQVEFTYYRNGENKKIKVLIG